MKTPKKGPYWAVRVVKGKRYLYRENRRREGARVFSKSVYIMPVELWKHARKLAGKLGARFWGKEQNQNKVHPSILCLAIRKARKPEERRLLRAAFSRLARANKTPVREFSKMHTKNRHAKTHPGRTQKYAKDYEDFKTHGPQDWVIADLLRTPPPHKGP